MAFISTAFTAGQTLTAASMEDLRGNANAGHSVFTNEAARDAAITAPTEGMMAYLTAPTVPAATGTTTAVPTGVLTIYNGSAWVCITPVGANSRTSATTTSTTYVTTLTGDATAISATVSTGTTALVTIGNLSTSSASPTRHFVTVSVSGATTIAAADTYGSVHTSAGIGFFGGFSKAVIITGLTAGANTFTLNYKTDAGNTATFVERTLVVQGIA